MTGWPTQAGRFELGDLALQSGATLPGAFLSWKTHGALNAARDNVIVYPTSYGAQYPDLEWLIGPDRILDPTKFFIMQIDMFANGGSSSPSNTPGWPGLVTIWDNVQAQHRLVQEQFGISRVAGVYGFSMGALQAYHWAACFPDQVDAAVVVCGVSRTAVHNQVFLKGLLAILHAAPEYTGHGQFSAEPKAALRAYGRIYAGWALSQDFYRAGLHLTALGAPDLEAFLDTWEASFSRRTAADYYAQASTWIAADICRQSALWRRPAEGAGARSRRACCCCRARRICISASPTTRRSWSIWRRPNCAPSPAFGATAPAIRRKIRWTMRSCGRRCRPGSASGTLCGVLPIVPVDDILIASRDVRCRNTIVVRPCSTVGHAGLRRKDPA